MYAYQWYQWLLFFYFYCFAGWVFESTYVSLKVRRPVNRGFLRLPLLPLYGTGAVMMLFVSLPIQDNLVLVYFSGVAAATVLEYVTGWAMERLFKVRYWDYSNQRFNVNGYICLSSSIAWGFLTLLLTEVLHKPVERLVLGISTGTAMGLACAVSVVFAADTVESFRAALDLGHALEMVTRMKGDLEELQLQLALLKEQLRDQTSERVQIAQEETAMRVAELKASVAARMNGMRGAAPLRALEATAAVIAEVKAEAALRLEELRNGTGQKLGLEELRSGVEQRLGLEELRSGAAQKLGLEELKEAAAERQQAILDKLDALKGKTDELRARHDQLRKRISPFRRFYLRGILRGNPTAVSRRYREALEDLQREIRRSAKKRLEEKGQEESGEKDNQE